MTGGTGFVGQQVTRALIERGHSVYLVSRRPDLLIPGTQLRQTDDLFSAGRAHLEDLLTGIDVVVHLAWYVDPTDYLSSDENWRCLSGSLRFALAARDMGISHFVGVGTCIEYERTDSVRTPKTRIDPDTAYGAAKASLFFSLREIFESKADWAWCRLFFLHGEGEDPRRLVPHVRSQIGEGIFPRLHSPNAIRDFMNVSEAGEKIAKIADLRLSGVFNVCSGKPRSVMELATEIATRMGRLDLVEQAVKNGLSEGATNVTTILGLPSPELDD